MSRPVMSNSYSHSDGRARGRGSGSRNIPSNNPQRPHHMGTPPGQQPFYQAVPQMQQWPMNPHIMSHHQGLQPAYSTSPQMQYIQQPFHQYPNLYPQIPTTLTPGGNYPGSYGTQSQNAAPAMTSQPQTGRPPSNPGMAQASMPQPGMMQAPQPGVTMHNQSGYVPRPMMPQQPNMQAQPQLPLPKRERRALAIVNPDTKEITNADQLNQDTNTPPPSSQATLEQTHTPEQRVTPEPATATTEQHTPPVQLTEPTPPSDSKAAAVASEFRNKVFAVAHSAPSSATDVTDGQGSSTPKVNGQVEQTVLPAAVAATKPAVEVSKPVVKPAEEALVLEAKQTTDSATISAEIAKPPAEATEAEESAKPASASAEQVEAPPATVQPAEETAAVEAKQAEEPAVVPAPESSTEPETHIGQVTEEPIASKSPDVAEIESAMQETSDVPEVSAKPAVVSAPAAETKPEPVKEATVEAQSAPVAAAPPANTEAVKAPKSDSELMPPPAAPAEPEPSPAPVPTPTDDKENSVPKDSPTSTPSIKAGSKSMSAAPVTVTSHKYEYKEDPSGPLDPEGKRTYDRNFLLKLQFTGASQSKPEGLAILNDIMVQNPLTEHVSAQNRGFGSKERNAFTPQFFKPLTPSRPSGQKDKRGSQTRGVQQTRTIDYKRQDIKLHRTENAWKPGDKTKAVEKDLSEEEKRNLALLSTFTGLLNKITPQNFARILEKVLALPVSSESDLIGIVGLVAEKAIAEPAFSVTYANLCNKLSKEFKVKPDGKNEEVSFRKVLLIRCQREFEQTSRDDDAITVKQAQVANTTDEKEKAQLLEEMELFSTKARKRKLGNIRFIGELFKLQMLVPKIMHECVVQLLKAGKQDNEEESLESLCQLLKTIGKDMDTDQARGRVDQYFTEIKKIIDNKKISSRIRFALQDVVELRGSNWKPRRENAGPKTIDQVHAEARVEAMETAAAAANAILPSRGSQRQQQSRGGDRGRQPNQDGWTVQAPSMKTQSQRIEPGKLKLTKQSHGDEVQLGPGRGMSSWGKGSSGSGKNTPPQQQEDRPSTPNNRFSMLEGGHEGGRSHSGTRMVTNRGSMGRGRGRLSNTPRGSMERERQSALNMTRDLTKRGSGSRGPSRDSSTEGRGVTRPPIAPAVKQAVKQLTRDDWELKAKSIIDEYLHNGDLKESISCVEELGAQTESDLLVECSINHVLERSVLARKGAGHLLAELVKRKLLPLDKYTKGLTAVLEFADDLAIDIPNVWQYFGELIGPVFCEGGVSLTELDSLTTVVKDTGKQAVVIRHILEEASHKVGHVELGKKWRDCGLQWSTFLSEGEDEKEFCKNNKLEYTLSSIDHQPVQRATSQEVVQSKLVVLLSEKACNEDIFDWVDANLAEKTAELPFIRSLVLSVTKSCLNGFKLDEEAMKVRTPLLQKYIDAKPDREAMALSSLEDLMAEMKHPAHLLETIFYALSEADLISDDSFHQWKRKNSSGIAIQSVSPFFKWLEETEDDN